MLNKVRRIGELFCKVEKFCIVVLLGDVMLPGRDYRVSTTPPPPIYASFYILSHKTVQEDLSKSLFVNLTCSCCNLCPIWYDANIRSVEAVEKQEIYYLSKKGFHKPFRNALSLSQSVRYKFGSGLMTTYSVPLTNIRTSFTNSIVNWLAKVYAAYL